MNDEIKHAAQHAKGSAEEAWGKVTDDKSMQAHGKFDKAAAETKDAFSDAKDRVEDAHDDDDED
jgi:uncharacterized protein YjbJ (UPF0337 family)